MPIILRSMELYEVLWNHMRQTSSMHRRDRLELPPALIKDLDCSFADSVTNLRANIRRELEVNLWPVS